jgi:diaminopimelate decarboxylase
LAEHLGQAAEQFGTPVYVIDEASLTRAADHVEAAFGGSWIRQYSLKANDLPAITAFLAGRGWGANVVSPGEWELARQAGVANADVTFEGIGKTDAHLESAVRQSAEGSPPRWLAIESAGEAYKICRLADAYGLGTNAAAAIDVLLRLNPHVAPETTAGLAVGDGSSKFGMTQNEIRELTGSKWFPRTGVVLRGIQVHAGSNLADVGAWVEAGVAATILLAELAPQASTADTVDYGGGFPLTNENGPQPSQFHDALANQLTSHRLSWPPRPAIEPGRFLVGEAGVLVCRVLHVRQRAGKAQIVLDGGMTELIRPALYGSRHPIWPLDLGNAIGDIDTLVEGPICESTDTFGSHSLPPMHRGDLVAIGSAGAYGASFTSRYNGRPQPAEVLLRSNGELELCARPPPAHLQMPIYNELRCSLSHRSGPLAVNQSPVPGTASVP